MSNSSSYPPSGGNPNAVDTLSGDVSATGTGASPTPATVNSVGGSSAANIHSAEQLANAATDAKTANAIVKRDASGKAALDVTGNADTATALTGVNDIAHGGTNATTATAALTNLLPSQTGNSGKFLTTNGTSTNWATPAGGGGAGGGITDLSGDVTSPVSSGTATTTVEFVGGSTAADVHTAEQKVNTSQSGNKVLTSPSDGSAGTPSFRALVPADIPQLNQNTTGNAATSTLANHASSADTATTATTATNFSGSLSGDVTGTQGATVIPNNSITNTKAAQMPANTIKGNNTGSTANSSDLTPSQVAALLAGQNLVNGLDIYTASTTPIVMTAASKRTIRIQGTAGVVQPITLPDATTLQTGTEYVFNVAGGIIVNINNTAGTLVFSTTGQNSATISLLINTTSAGTWSRSASVIGLTQGGTGQVTANASLNALLPSQPTNDNKVLTTDGTNSSWSYKSGLVAVVYSVAGSYTWTPPPNCNFVRVTGRPASGGGGGSGGGGAGSNSSTAGGGGGKGGGAGGSCNSVTLTVAVTPGLAVSISVGAAGIGGTGGIVSTSTAPTAGGNGGVSSFGIITWGNGNIGGAGGGAGSNGGNASGTTAGTAGTAGGTVGASYNGATAGSTTGNGGAGGAGSNGVGGTGSTPPSDNRFGITTPASFSGGAGGTAIGGFGGGGGGGAGGSSGPTTDQNIYGLGLMDSSGLGAAGGKGGNANSSGVATSGTNGTAGTAGTAGRGGGGAGGGGGGGGGSVGSAIGGSGSSGGNGCDGLIAIEYCG